MEYLAIPLVILALAFMFHGFPDIHIGTKKYYERKDKEEK